MQVILYEIEFKIKFKNKKRNNATHISMDNILKKLTDLEKSQHEIRRQALDLEARLAKLELSKVFTRTN